MRIAILGTGALGCVFAARLAPLAEVWMVGTWAAGVEAVRQHGVRLYEPDGRLRQVAVAATTNPAEVPAADLVLLLVKSYQTERAAAWAAQILAAERERGEPALALTLQNGLDNYERLVGTVGARRAVAGVTYNGATLLGPGEVRHVAILPTYIGLPRFTASGHAASSVVPGQAELEQTARLLTAAGLETHVEQDITGRLWGKALANAAINPLTALWRVPNGDLLASADRRALLHALAEEVAAVARGLGITLPYADAAAYVEEVCRATAANRSSMLQDVERGRPTEIDSINGVIVAQGRQIGVPVPVNETVWRLVRGLTAL